MEDIINNPDKPRDWSWLCKRDFITGEFVIKFKDKFHDRDCSIKSQNSQV